VRISGRHGAAAAEICCRAPTPRYAEPSAAASSTSATKPSSSSTCAVSAPSCGAGPATWPELRENQVGAAGVCSGAMKPPLVRYGSAPPPASRSRAPAGVEHGTVGMLDQSERCHGFEYGDFYFPTFAGCFLVKQRHRRRVNLRGYARPVSQSALQPADQFPGQKPILAADKIDESANIAPFTQIHERLVDLIEPVMPGD
jgi:hypothetical protein